MGKTDKGREAGRHARLVTRQTDGAAGSFWIRTVLTGAEQHGKPAVVHHLPPSTKDPKTTMLCVSLFASLCPNKCKLIIQLQHSFVDAVLFKARKLSTLCDKYEMAECEN